ncbi:hypothetical protein BaOVIS_004730 [Babesia ovis]|uniref:Uncharacterized protein n=1 Tax=Babesia ovis TaxID=5869 RepID=A0A9W5WTR6_BABOV|nr:hypothetical protein BaOVIS_004730 [Babesia ovis]
MANVSRTHRLLQGILHAISRGDRGISIALLLLCFIPVAWCLCCIYSSNRRRTRHTTADSGTNNGRKDSKPSVSIVANDLLLNKGSYDLIEDNVLSLADLASKLNLYIFIQVSGEDDIPIIMSKLENSGFFGDRVKKHRILFSATSEGRASMVRQLQPQLHMETDPSVVEAIAGKVPNILKFAVNQGSVHPGDDIVTIESAASIIGIVQPLFA